MLQQVFIAVFISMAVPHSWKCVQNFTDENLWVDGNSTPSVWESMPAAFGLHWISLLLSIGLLLVPSTWPLGVKWLEAPFLLAFEFRIVLLSIGP